MMGYTDRFFRALLRCLNSEIILYTQMIPCGKVLHRDDWCERFVYSKDQGRVIVQLGGGNPSELAASTDRLVALGYTEINLNVGCPSARVQLGNIGAVLFKDPKLVAECVRAMQGKGAEITVKTRLGVDDCDRYEDVVRFVSTVADAGVTTFIMHARKAWLKGLSAKENREIPPLRYDWVQRLQVDFPKITFILNGGIGSCEEVKGCLQDFPGVMLGRAVCRRPEIVAELDGSQCDDLYVYRAVKEYLSYVERGVVGPQDRPLKPLLYLFTGKAGVKRWRQGISDQERSGCWDVLSLYQSLSSLRTKA